MKRIPIRLMTVFLLVTGLSATALAAGTKDTRRTPRSEATREEVRKKVETLRMWRLTQVLELDEPSAARIFPMLSAYERKRATLERQISEDLDALRELLKQGEKKTLKDTLQRIEKNHLSLQSLRHQEYDELKGILTIEQQAQFILFQEDFAREVRKLIRESRKRD